MSREPAVKNYFAGGNTAYGFFPLFDNILQDGKKLIILKGGPGTGKSTILKHIRGLMLERGFDVECFYCSSDTFSLDGVALPALKVAVIDGTAPHMIDPVLPGAYDEIVNLGEHWDETVLQSNRSEITAVSEAISYSFSSAYRYLGEAKLALDHLRLLTADVVDYAYADTVTHNLLAGLLGSESYRGKGRERHLFAGAITPEGFVNFYANLVSGCSGFYFIDGDPGTGKSTLLNKLYQGFRLKGFDLEVYRCALDPHRIDALVVPAKKLAFINATEPHRFALNASHRVDFTETLTLNYYSSKKDSPERSLRRDEYRKNIVSLLEKALACMQDAKTNSALREKYYCKAMDFTAIDKTRDRIVDKIMALEA